MAENTVDVQPVYSPVVGAGKATKNTIIQAVIWILSMIIANWGFIYTMLPQWKEITVGAAIIWVLNFVWNWLKNKNPN